MWIGVFALGVFAGMLFMMVLFMAAHGATLASPRRKLQVPEP